MEAATTPAERTERVFYGGLMTEGIRRYDDGIVNWYLIEDAGGLTAVDAGFPPAWQILLSSLGTLGRPLSDLRAVVLTHAHIDHVGFAARAHEEAGATIYVHEADTPLLRNPLNMARSERGPLRYLNQPATRQVLLRAVMSGAPFAQRVQEYQTYSDGETLDVPGSPTVVFCPGHSDGHSALHLRDRGVLFVGDAIVTRDPYTGLLGPRLVAAAATKDTGRNLESLDRLRDLEAQLLLPGHGDPFRGSPAEAVEQARRAGSA
jgi:glyoxylase-like metal-dependent hydrolase (beta-lactamase superfamily II)